MSPTSLSSVPQIRDKICDVISAKRISWPKERIKSILASDHHISPRKLSSVNDINELFDLLERLGLATITNLTGFRVLAEILESDELIQLINQFSTVPVPAHQQVAVGFNQYAFRRALHKVSSNADPNEVVAHNKLGDYNADPVPAATQVVCNQDSVTTRNVFGMLSVEVGRRWRDLGRKLGFCEGELDDLEARHEKGLIDRIYAMLVEYSERNRHLSEQDLLRQLISALNECRRVDLRKKIEELLRK